MGHLKRGDTMNQGEYLRNLRITAGLKQRELAELLGTSRDYISVLERNVKCLSDNFRMKYFKVLNSLGLEIRLEDIFLNTIRH